tara:strand:+ start:652 stop:1377 length:726 start_codon:yes stop_codon:yes gene_type:complete
MMEATARKKAHWLFGAGSEKTFSGKRRPQEDMVTSAVFGSIRLMAPEDRCKAIEMLLGPACWSATGFAGNRDVEIDLWPQNYRIGRNGPEPDVILKAKDNTVIVEVKWRAPLSDRQLENQIDAVGAENITAVVMLGEAGVEEKLLGIPCFRRTWRDVSGDFQGWQENGDTPLRRWVNTMHDFLQETDMGRIFNGLPPFNGQPRLKSVGQISYQFSKPGHSPWFDLVPTAAQPVRYTYEGNQ